MSHLMDTHEVDDSVAQINKEIAVGEDLQFQEKWWRFERIAWIGFSFLLILDLAGAFGRGPLAKAERHTADGTFNMKYERIERTGTPSVMTFQVGTAAVQNGKLRLFVSQSLVNELGTQRVIPAPESTTIGQGGLTYVFPVSALPATVEFALQPSGPGLYDFTVAVPGQDAVTAKVVVVP